ncbi:unnamed protein product [Ectocarpus sp. 8 AP-2014]
MSIEAHLHQAMRRRCCCWRAGAPTREQRYARVQEEADATNAPLNKHHRTAPTATTTTSTTTRATTSSKRDHLEPSHRARNAWDNDGRANNAKKRKDFHSIL